MKNNYIDGNDDVIGFRQRPEEPSENTKKSSRLSRSRKSSKTSDSSSMNGGATVLEDRFDKSNDTNSLDQRKRFFILAGVLVVVAALVGGSILYFFGGNDNPDPNVGVNNVIISDFDKKSIDPLTQEFIAVAGKWGLNEGSVSETSFLDLRYLVSSDDSSRVSNAWWNRAEVYDQVKKNYLASFGPLLFNQNEIDSWSKDQIAQDGLASFRTTVDSVITADTGQMLQSSGQNYKMAMTTVNFTTTEKIFQQTRDDTDWDGTLKIQEKPFNETVVVKSIQLPDGSWKIYDIINQKYSFLLALWKGLDPDYFWTQTSGFTDAGTLKAKVK